MVSTLVQNGRFLIIARSDFYVYRFFLASFRLPRTEDSLHHVFGGSHKHQKLYGLSAC